MTFVIANDGYIARELPKWTKEKLFLVERYFNIFCVAMRDKWPSLVYADLLAGPGLCVNKETREEWPGSPLLALQRPEFQRLFLNDKSPHVTRALAARMSDASPNRVRIATMDCNEAVDAAREFLFPLGSTKGTLGLAVIDPTGFQISFDAISRLTTGTKFDLIIIYMTGHAYRFIAARDLEASLDRFLGMHEWRSLIGTNITMRSILDLYNHQLKKIGYNYIIDHDHVLNSNNRPIYHIVFASRNSRGAELFEKINLKTSTGQLKMF